SEVLRAEATFAHAEAGRIRYRDLGPAEVGNDPEEVVVGVSPGFGLRLFRTLAGHPLSAVLRALNDGLAERGIKMRLVRFGHTADTSFLGLSAASLSGS